jgi:phospholipid/cholesterol/gamma-HCH transport system substrate-binding protein
MKRRNEVAVGVLVTVALLVLVIGAVWLARGGLSSGYPLYTQFAWGQNLKKGQPVLLAGVNVGYVDQVRLRREGLLDVKLNIQDEYTIPAGSDATVIAVGIFGDVAVSLNPPMPVPAASYQRGDTVPAGEPSASVTTIMNRVDSIGTSIARLAAAMETDLVATGGLRDLRQTIAGTLAMTAQVQRVLAQQNENMTLTMASLRQTSERVGSLVEKQAVDSTLRGMQVATANLNQLLVNIDSTRGQLDLMMVRLNRGEGDLGRLMRDTTLTTATQALLARMDSLLVDFQRNPRRYIPPIRIF